MNTFNNMETILNSTRTENGDLALHSTKNKNLDLFGLMGSMNHNDENLYGLFMDAYNENPELAIMNLFYLRDVRGGMGRRDAFRRILQMLAQKDPAKVKKILELIPEYGRWDDLVGLLDVPLLEDAVLFVIGVQLKKDLSSTDNVSLLAKWLPSINASSKKTTAYAKKIAKGLGMSEPLYRKILSKLRKRINIVESKLSKKEYDFDYSQLPSKAMNKYQKAFHRNDRERYEGYLEELTQGKTKVNVSTLYPHEIIRGTISSWRRVADVTPLQEAQWKALDRTKSDTNAIVVRDGSGSMMGKPIEIATALSILYSEQLTGEFKDKFITFSRNPELVDLSSCKTLADKIAVCNKYGSIQNTDIEKTYNLIFKASKGVPYEEQIDRMVIISDMEFDYGAEYSQSTYDAIKAKYAKAEMKFPEIVYWNVNARSIHFPAGKDENIKLISGFSNSVLQDVMTSKDLSPTTFMLNALSRYRHVADLYVS